MSRSDRRPPLDIEASQVLEELAALGEPELTSMHPQAARALRAARYRARSVGAVADDGVEELEVGGVPSTLYRTHGRTAPVVVWMHGGGWVLGGRVTHEEVFATLARESGCHVLAPEYRLAPEHRFPAALDDGCRVLADLVVHPPAGLDTERLVVGGDSAGGNLAIVMAVETGVSLRGLALAYPVTDARCGSSSYGDDHRSSYLQPEWMRWFVAHYVGPSGDTGDWRVSPLLAPREALGSLPPTLVLLAGHDPLYREGLDFARRVLEAGVPTDLIEALDLPHGFLGFAARSSAAQRRFEQLGHWISAIVDA